MARGLFLLIFLVSLESVARLESACFPDPNDPEMMAALQAAGVSDLHSILDWPVSAIYLHGWDDITQNGSTDELANRERLRELAIELARRGERIALPVSGMTRRDPNGRTVLHWPSNSVMPLEEASASSREQSVEGLARMACSSDGSGDDVELAHPRTLMGYSNGAYKALYLAEGMPCPGGYLNGHYTRVIAIGARQARSSCGALRVNTGHSPANFSNRLDGYLQGWEVTGAVRTSPRAAPRGQPYTPGVIED